MCDVHKLGKGGFQEHSHNIKKWDFILLLFNIEIIFFFFSYFGRMEIPT